MRSVRTRSDLTERAKVFLAAGVGEIAVTEACRQLDMTRQRFYELEDRPMAAEFRELEPKPAGRPPKAVDPRAALEKQAAVLQKEKDRLWLYIRVLQRMAGIDNPETETKRSPRRASDGDKAHDR